MDTIKCAADALFTDTSLGGFPLFKNGNLGDIQNGANEFISLIFFSFDLSILFDAEKLRSEEF